MAFEFVKTLEGHREISEPIVIKNAIAVAVGDAVEVYTNGEVTNAVKLTPVAGIVYAICDRLGNPIPTGTPVAGTAKTTTYTSVTGDGATYYAKIDKSPNSVYSVTVNGTLGTTNNSDLPACTTDVDSDNTNYGRVLETTASRTANVASNFYSHGVDPRDSTRLLVSIANSERVTDRG